MAAPLPAFSSTWWAMTSPALACWSMSSAVPSVDPSLTTTISFEQPAGRAAAFTRLSTCVNIRNSL